MTNELAKIVNGQEIVNPDDPNAIFAPEGLKQVLAVCDHLIKSNALPSAIKTPEQALLVIQAGRELGMKPIESFNGLLPINGQIKLWGTALTGRASRLGYKFKWIEMTDQKATVALVTPDGQELTPESYTIQDATKAGLLGKSNWKNYPKVMLRWRAISNAVKFHCPHIMQGFALVEDDDNINTGQGIYETEQVDNASKLLNKNKEEKIEVKVDSSTGKDETVATVETLDKDKENNLNEILTLITESKSKLVNILNFYKVNELKKFTPEQLADLKEKLLIKIEEMKNLPPANNVTIEKPDEEVTRVPGDVCQYLNSLSDVDKSMWPSDIIMLEIDCNRGAFKGYEAYPSLRAELELFNKPKEIKSTAKFEPVSLEIIEMSDAVSAINPAELTEEQKTFLTDCKNNQFRGKAAYPSIF